MSKVAISKEKIVAVADAIREKAGTTDEMTLDAMPTAISEIQSGGADFTISDASYLFYKGARLELLEVLAPLLKDITNTANMFGYNDMSTINLNNFDFSKTNDTSGMFTNCKGDSIDLSNANITATVMSGMFSNSKFKRIDLSGLNEPGVTNSDYSMSMFSGCSQLEYLFFPHVKQIYYRCFYSVGSATTNGAVIDLNGSFDRILDSTSFNGTTSAYSKISALILRQNRLVTLSSTSTFNYCWIKTETDKGFVYVPDELVEEYKAATNWSTFANKIKPLSEYEEVV